MADLSRLTGPPLPDNRQAGAAAQALRSMYSYLYQQTEQMQYVLANLDENNFSEAMRAQLARLEQGTPGWPVGAVFWCAGDAGPAAQFGGRWEELADCARTLADGASLRAWRRVA